MKKFFPFPILGRKSLSALLQILCWIFFFLGILILAFLPFILNAFIRAWFRQGGFPVENFYRMLVVLYPAGVLGLAVVWQLKGLLKDVNLGLPFTRENVKRIRRVSLCCFLIGALFFTFVFPSFVAPLLLGTAFWFVSALSLVLSELVKQAAIFKEENELTV